MKARWVAVPAALLALVMVTPPAAALATRGPGATGLTSSSAASDVTLTGRGYGHGKGMSQYGAKGRAEAGHTYTQILAHYYPGAALQVDSDAKPITVWVTADTDNQASVVAEQGMTLQTSDPDTPGLSYVVDVPRDVRAAGGVRAQPVQWRLRLISYTFTLEGLVGGTWYPHDSPDVTSALRNMQRATLSAPDGTVRLVIGSTHREYRGAVGANRIEGGTLVRTTVTTTMGNYLRSVVPSEMPALWSAAAVQAQSVAARTYASYDRDVASRPWWYDTCDTTACQVFSGAAHYDASGRLLRSYEHAASTAAVAATAGRILTSAGRPAFTQFSASNGGYSLAGTQPYLAARPDPFDKYPTWTVGLSREQISTRYPAIGSFRSMSVVRDGRGEYGGRVTTVVLRGSSGSVSVTGDAFRSAMGLRSTLWTPSAVTQPPPVVPFEQIVAGPDLTGDGRADLTAVDSVGRLHVYAGTGEGRLGRVRSYGTGWSVLDVYAPGDWTGDRAGDLIAVDGAGVLWLYAGDGTGGFAGRTKIGHGWTGFRIVPAGDVDANGTMDLLAIDSASRLWLYPGDGRGGFRSRVQAGHGWSGFQLHGAGDMNRDGRVDILSIDPAGRLWYYAGRGGGRFSQRINVGYGWTGYAFASGGDFNGDGVNDLMGRDPRGRLWFYAGRQQGTFAMKVQVGQGW